MNKLAIALSAALSLGAAASANAAEATINFTGTISSVTCPIAAGGASGTAVTLMPTSISTITNGSDAARETAFNLTLGNSGTKCPGETATIEFEKTNVETNGRLKNTASTGAAANVELALIYEDAEVNLQTSTGIEADEVGDNTYLFPLKARYEKLAAGDVTEGSFTSALGINVSYR
ncbi:TPA: type 1 fimbrial protein [Stenotrophomonas maltophilia]|nr:type 1 fimbrial protein [Stenotrophomonas maltophilia]